MVASGGGSTVGRVSIIRLGGVPGGQHSTVQHSWRAADGATLFSLWRPKVFNVAPTVFEVTAVTAILTAKCGPALGAITLGTLAGAAAAPCP